VVAVEYSMHNFLLRYYVADTPSIRTPTIQIRVTPPPDATRRHHGLAAITSYIYLS